MKRKISLFTVLAIMLVCVLALSVSAKTVISESNVSEDGETVAIYLGDYSIDGSTQQVSFIDITYLDENGETKEGKMYFVTNYWSGNTQMHSTYLPADFDMSQMVYMPDRIDLGNGSYKNITGTQGDKNLYLKYDSYSEGVFTNTVNVKSQLVRICYSRYLTYFGPAAYSKIPLTTLTYSGREAVEGTFFVSPRVTQIYGGSTNSAFGGSANGNINGDTCLFTRLVFEERTGSVSFGQYALCRNVIEEVVFLGTGTYNIGGDSIAYLWYEGTNTPCLKRVVVQDGVNISGSIALNVGTYDVVFIGTEEQYNSQTFSALTNATGNVSYETICYVYGHTDSNDYDCTTTDYCTIDGCGEILRVGNEAHNENGVADFADYYSTITETITCNNEGCNHKAVNTLAPIFKFDGYSVKEGENIAICASFSINNYALKRYCTGVSFGVIGTAFEEGEVKGELFDENGNVPSSVGSVIHAKLDAQCKKIDFKLISDKWETYGDLELVMALYSFDKNGIQYINGANNAHTTYETVTYNKVLGAK